MRLILCCFLLLAISTSAIADEPGLRDSPQVRNDGWEVASLSDSGFDITKMRLFDRELEGAEFTNLHMVVVEYDGKLVYEKYLSGNDQSWGSSIGHRQFDHESLHDLRSISKSVTALLLGMALGENFKTELSRPIIDFFPELRTQIAAGAEKITLEQVLTMSTGLEWNEMDVSYSNNNNDEIRMYYQSDPVTFVLNKPMRDEPGVDWYYNGGTTMLLAALVEKLSGKPFLEYAEEKLAIPLGIDKSKTEWRGLGIWRSQKTLPSAASGLRLRARDLARIGSLMLHNGKWQGRQVVPSGWVRASSQRHLEQTYSKWSSGGVYGYGYHWWHGQFNGNSEDFSAVTGVGYGGQRLFVIAGKKLVVTVFAGNYGTGIREMSERAMLRVVDAAP